MGVAGRAVAMLLGISMQRAITPAAIMADAPPVQSETVNVFAAASLTAAFQAVAKAFEQQHPGIKVQLNFAGSPTLVQQIREGAPADVFAAADETNMQKLVESGEVSGSPEIFTQNAMQIVVQAGNPAHILTLADMMRPGLTIALCGATVPCGRYAAEVFGKAGVPVPAASQETDVRAVLNKVTMGEADAGIVYVTDVRAAGQGAEGIDVPANVNVTARYPIAVLKHAPHAAAATAYLHFVLSPPAQQLLTTFGFAPR